MNVGQIRIAAGSFCLLVLFGAGCGGSASHGDASSTGLDAGTRVDAGVTDAHAMDAPLSDGSVPSDGGSTAVDASSRAHITAAAGGTVTSPDGIFSLVIPAHALAADTDFSISIVAHADWPAALTTAPPIAELYDIEPDGITFLVPAYGVHSFATAPAALTSAAGDPLFVTHYMLAADGTVSSATATDTYTQAPGPVEIVATVAHTSKHWASLHIVDDHGDEGQVGARFMADAGHHTVGDTWRATRVQLVSDFDFTFDSYRLGSAVSVPYSPSAVFALSPVVDSGTIAPAGISWGSRYLYNLSNSPARGSITITGGASTSFAMPLPGWRCDSVGTATTFASVKLGSSTLEAKIGDPDCAASSTRSYTTVPFPEGIQLFKVGTTTDPGASDAVQITTTGLTSGVYVAVAGGAPTGGGALDLIRLTDGVRRTDMTPPFGAYGVTVWQSTTGPAWTLFGRYGLEDDAFGSVTLSGHPNTTQYKQYDRNGDGIAEIEVQTTAGGIIVNQGATSHGVSPTSAFFPGVTSPVPLSSALGPDGNSLFVVLTSGEVFYGPYTGGGLTNVGSAGPSPRLATCVAVSAALTVCAIAGYTDNMLYFAEIDGTGAHMTADYPVGHGPVEPALRVEGSLVRTAIAGSMDNTLWTMIYDPAHRAGAVTYNAFIDSCLTPSHVAIVDGTEAVASCNGSNNLVRVPLPH